jgi:hypothetical protein
LLWHAAYVENTVSVRGDQTGSALIEFMPDDGGDELLVRVQSRRGNFRAAIYLLPTSGKFRMRNRASRLMLLLTPEGSTFLIWSQYQLQAFASNFRALNDRSKPRI